MNHLTLQAVVSTAPELRHTSNNQTAVAEFVVEFISGKDNELTEALRCTAWGDRANDAATNLRQGQQVVLEGSLSIASVERPEGHKDKVATLNVLRWHFFGTPPKAASAPVQSSPQKAATHSAKRSTPSAQTASVDDFDDIPF